MKVIVAGSRSITSYEVVDLAIQIGCKRLGITITELIEGEAPGVDTLAKQWAINNNIPFRPFPAKWNDVKAKGAVVKINKFGRPYNVLAGKWRNEEMAIYTTPGGALIAVWDGKSTGTQDMIERANDYGLLVTTVEV